MQYKLLGEIRPHPLNDEIYADRADSELVESVNNKGVINPILIDYDNRIISGHRRYNAATIAGLETVPVVVFLSQDELDIQEALIESNRQRQKTGEMIGREYKHLKRIYNERGSRQGARSDISEKNHSTSDARASEVPPTRKAAVAIGTSFDTARRAETVVDVIDRLKADNQPAANELTAQLNRSINGAYNTVKNAGLLQPKPVEQPKALPRQAEYITLADWDNGIKDTGDRVKTAMNTTNDNIEWAAFSWNPLTGCLHNCDYCYARDIANRFFPQKFDPSFLPERLSQPENTKPIAPRWPGDIGHTNVFTCSMADLFGKWVPAEWINAVLDTIAKNPQWTFLLLTKFPARMAEFTYPDNIWLGTSVDHQWAVDRAEKAFTKIKASGFNGVCWLSCEPMLERLTFNSLSMFDWVVYGGASKSTQTPEYVPPLDDIISLYNQARSAGCKIYQKTNLMPGISDSQRIREYPVKESK